MSSVPEKSGMLPAFLSNPATLAISILLGSGFAGGSGVLAIASNSNVVENFDTRMDSLEGHLTRVATNVQELTTEVALNTKGVEAVDELRDEMRAEILEIRSEISDVRQHSAFHAEKGAHSEASARIAALEREVDRLSERKRD